MIIKDLELIELCKIFNVNYKGLLESINVNKGKQVRG